MSNIIRYFVKWCRKPRTSAWAQLTDIVVSAQQESATQARIEAIFSELRAS